MESKLFSLENPNLGAALSGHLEPRHTARRTPSGPQYQEKNGPARPAGDLMEKFLEIFLSGFLKIEPESMRNSLKPVTTRGYRSTQP